MRRSLNNLHLKIWTWMTRDEGFLKRDDGQGLTEYALILALIAIVAIAALTLLGGKVTSSLRTVANSINA